MPSLGTTPRKRDKSTGRLDTLGRPIYESSAKADKPAAERKVGVVKRAMPIPGSRADMVAPWRREVDRLYPFEGRDKYSAEAIAAADRMLAPSKRPRASLKLVRCTERKHFGDRAVAGRIQVGGIRELLAMAAEQRANGLDGDDREDMMAMGVPRWAVGSCSHRYILAEVPGESGVRSQEDFPEDTPVYLTRKRPDLPPAFAVVGERKKTEYATILLGSTSEQEDDHFITAFPGLPAKQKSTVPQDKVESLEDAFRKAGGSLPMSQVRQLMGARSFSVLAADRVEDIPLRIR